MKYFRVSISDDLEIIGHYPQTDLRIDHDDLGQ